MSFDDGLMDGGATSFKFENRGDKVEGFIESVEKKQQTDMETGKPEFWDDGSPKYQFVFTLQTDLRTSEDDDGRRRIFAKFKLLKAIQDAVRGSKHKGSVVGGKLKVQFHATEPAKTRGYSPTKLYRAEFTPPAPASDADSWGSEPDSGGQSPADQGADIPF